MAGGGDRRALKAGMEVMRKAYWPAVLLLCLGAAGAREALIQAAEVSPKAAAARQGRPPPAAAGEQKGAPADTAAPPSPKPIVAVPFEIYDNKPALKVRVNGSDPVWFLLDTGAGGDITVARRLAKALGLPITQEERKNTGAGVGVRVRVGRIPGVKAGLGNFEVFLGAAASVELAPLADYDEVDCLGLLGHGFLARFVVEIDYGKKRLSLYDPETFVYRGRGRSLPLRFIGHLPALRAELVLPGGPAIEDTFVVDTGARMVLVLSTPFVARHGLLDLPGGIDDTVVGCGVGGLSRGSVRRIAGLRLGPFLVRRPVVVLSSDRGGVLAGRAFAGIIGGGILKRCKVVFDYSRKEMILEPLAARPVPYEYDMSGMFLAAAPGGRPPFRVVAVAKGTPAAEAGIAAGDVITAVNEKPAGEFTLRSLRALLIGAGSRVDLEIEHSSGERTRVEIVLRRLV